MIYLKLLNTQEEYDDYIVDYRNSPNVNYCKFNKHVNYKKRIPYDYSNDYFTLVARESGTFKLTKNSVYYSLDNGNTWTQLPANTDSPTVSAGSKILWKGTCSIYGTEGIGTFGSTCDFNAEGNTMSLLYGDNFRGQTALMGDSNFYNLFRNSNIVEAHNMILPATTVTNACYCLMFYTCSKLISAPYLPATTLGYGCYQQMFQNCFSLVTVQEVLPATTLSTLCYAGTYLNCQYLTTAPILPATTLGDSVYLNMFNGCSRLSYVKAMFTTAPGTWTDDTRGWMTGVASTGTFVKNANATWTTTGDNGIPNGWTVQNE